MATVTLLQWGGLLDNSDAVHVEFQGGCICLRSNMQPADQTPGTLNTHTLLQHGRCRVEDALPRLRVLRQHETLCGRLVPGVTPCRGILRLETGAGPCGPWSPPVRSEFS